MGSWGTTAINTNMSALDGILGGFATISLSSATTFALTLPSGSLTPGAGPVQSENALLKFTGLLTGNVVVQFGLPGFYIIHNQCTVGAFAIQLSPASGGGNSIGAPPGQKVHIFFDGTDMDYVDLPPVGSALDLHQSGTTLPAWMTACTVRPFLIKDGTVYNFSTYPQLGAALGSAFGGNGVTTFAVPDELSRLRLPVDSSGAAARVTALSGITGTQMGSAGGSQLMQQHNHTASVTDPGHVHTLNFNPFVGQNFGSNPANVVNGGGTYAGVNSATTGITVANATTGTGTSQNMPPAIVSFLPLIKT